MKFRRVTEKFTGALLAVLLMALSLSGCGKNDAQQDQIRQVKCDYTPVQLYVLMGSMREAVADTYTEDVFTAVVDAAGGTYDDKFQGIMHDYAEKLTLMLAMAGERELKLTSDEDRAVGKLADAYMEAVSGSQAAEGIEHSDIVKVFTDQMLLPKLREDIMGGSDIEISDSEARVMDISMIVTDSSESANEAMAQLTDGKDFKEVAESHTVQEEIEMKVCREDLPDAIRDTVFDLEDGTLSPVMQSGGRYYIVRCDTGYDVEETALRKTQMTKERRRESVGTAYRQFCEDHECVIDDETWAAALQMYQEKGSLPDVFTYMDED